MTAAVAMGAVEEAKRLIELDAPEETPYVHMYKARDVLLEALNNDPTSIPLHSMLGQVYLAVEEPHTAQPCLERGLQIVPGSEELISFCNRLQDEKATLDTLTTDLPEFDTPESFDAHRADIMDILNQLGILWFNRTSYGRAYCYLKTAEGMFLYSSEPGMRPTYTHTLFYLAQLYGHLNAPEKSAMYCQLTLRHQLDDQNNLPRDWVQNCLHLSEYFLKQNQLPKASQCIHACTTVGPQPDEEAQIAANLAKLYIQTLYLAQHNIDLIPDTDVLFPNLHTRDTFISPSEIDSFDAARDVFKKAMAALSTAKSYFVLDGFVTDHIRLLQSQSRCYAKLIPFEPDRKRQMAMHQKRIDVYDPILRGEFNLNAYGYLLQEIYYEVGEIYSVLHDLKVVHLTRSYMETNQYAVDSIRSFEKFLQLYYYQQGKSDTMEPLPLSLHIPTHMDAQNADDLKPFFNGVFFLTRVYGKVQFHDDSKTVLFWTKCLEMHENLLKLIPPLGLPNFFVDEMAISQEMILLLPEKINHLHYKRRRL